MLKSVPVSKPQGSTEQVLSRDQALTRLAVSDYVMLTEPRIISLLLVTTLVPMFLAGSQPPGGWLILWTMLWWLPGGGWRQHDQPIRGSRHRPCNGAYAAAAVAGWPYVTLASAVVWGRSHGGRLCAALVADKPAHRSACAGGLFVLCLCIYRDAQADKHTEHCDRWGSWRCAAAGRLGTLL